MIHRLLLHSVLSSCTSQSVAITADATLLACGLGRNEYLRAENDKPSVVRIWSLDPDSLDLSHLKDLNGGHTSTITGVVWRADKRSGLTEVLCIDPSICPEFSCPPISILVKFSPPSRSRVMISGSSDRSIAVWDVERGELLRKLDGCVVKSPLLDITECLIM